MKLRFNVHKQTLCREDDEMLASYSKNFVRCKFKCHPPWDDVYKYALFSDTSNKKYAVDLGYGYDVQCKIPCDVLKGNYFSVSVFGGNRLTTNQETILLNPSGFSDAVENLFENPTNSNSDILTTSADSVDSDRPRLVTCFNGFTILKNPQREEHLYYY